jgi:hypothetical protein
MNKSSNLFVKAFYSVLIYGGYNCNIRLTCFYIIHDLRQDMKNVVTQSRTGLQIYEGRDDQLNRPGPMA